MNEVFRGKAKKKDHKVACESQWKIYFNMLWVKKGKKLWSLIFMSTYSPMLGCVNNIFARGWPTSARESSYKNIPRTFYVKTLYVYIYEHLLIHDDTGFISNTNNTNTTHVCKTILIFS